MEPSLRVFASFFSRTIVLSPASRASASRSGGLRHGVVGVRVDPRARRHARLRLRQPRHRRVRVELAELHPVREEPRRGDVEVVDRVQARARRDVHPDRVHRPARRRAGGGRAAVVARVGEAGVALRVLAGAEGERERLDHRDRMREPGGLPVVLRVDAGRDRVAVAGEVTLEAERLPHQRVDQVRVGGRRNAVHAVVGAHHGARLRRLDDVAERLGVVLANRPVVGVGRARRGG